ncbi:SpoIIE family protein phosphatase [Kineococcus sp. SYSU DK005]|uniref:SpoIIE family protein phosphatase n=1 Tax=Kineococcus sp. SYSU DK005 TaxID=3383126 RepID=UPI003D7ECAE9
MPQTPSSDEKLSTVSMDAVGPAAGTSAARAAAEALSADEVRVAAARRLRPSAGTLPGLDRLAGLAARLLGAGSGRVALIGTEQALLGAAGPQPTAGEEGEGPLAQWLCTQTAAAGAPLAIADTAADERVADLAPVASGMVASYLGVPLRVQDGSGADRVVGAVCVFEPAPRAWSSQDVQLLQQIAAAAAAELELSAISSEYAADRTLLELTIGAAELGTFDLDLASGELKMNERLLRLSAISPQAFGGTAQEVYAHLHPEDREATIAAVQRASTHGGTYTAQYRIVAVDGTHRWIAARGATLPGPDGAPARLLGAAYDITAVREGASRIEQILDSMAVAYLAMDEHWTITYANAEVERIAAASREELLGRSFWEAFPATVGTVFEERYRHAVGTGKTVVFDAFYPEPLNVWVEVRAVPENGGLALYFLDITARKQAQQTAEDAQRVAEQAQRASQDAQRSAEDAAARLALLAAVSAQLTGALDAQSAEVAVQRLAQLVVPALGDWCVITLVDDDAPASTPATARAASTSGRLRELRRGLRDVGWWHREEQLRELVREYAGCRLAQLSDESFLWKALRQSAPLSVPDATRAVGAVLEPGGRAQQLLTQLAPGFAAVFPLRARGRSVGVLTLFASPQRGGLSAQDMATAAEVADRAGLALDAARLYRQQRDLAAALQRSLLSEPPQPDHGQIVVRYAPAAEAAQVGGDWYDAFLQAKGATVLVIGDVIGHDTEAAAAMSQVRTLVRSIGALDDDTPAQVLAKADRTMANLQISTTATAIVARLEQDLDERARGITRLRWSNAGHPPAVVIDTDGSVRVLDEKHTGAHADLLLGVLPELTRTDHEVVLERDATVLLYTDGLVERRDQPLQAGLEKLQEVLVDLAADDSDLDTLVDRLLVEMLPARPEDDVAIIAVRLHRQDRPRPLEAGPQRVPAHVPPEPGAGEEHDGERAGG